MHTRTDASDLRPRAGGATIPGRARMAAAAAGGLTLGAALAGVPTASAANDVDVYTVENLNSLGPESLREAIFLTDDNDDSGAIDEIHFAAGLTGTINVTVGPFVTIDEPLTISGPGASVLTVNGGASYRAFTVNAASSDEVTISGLRIVGHTAANDGGAIVANGGDLTLERVAITNSGTTGSANDGGGVSLDGGGDLTITDSTVSGNSTTGDQANGGGVQFEGAGQLTIRRSTISGNETTGQNANGGGVYAFGEVLIDRSTLSGNSTAGGGADGGALLNYGSTTITNSTISGNETTGFNAFGGGMNLYNVSPTDQSSVISSTITGNSAAQEVGGGIALGGGSILPAKITSSIVAGNSSGVGGPDLGAPNSDFDFELRHSLIGNASSAGTLVRVPGRPSKLGVKPRLLPLTKNGGPTKTHALALNSPALDAGSATGTDQRVKQRRFDLSFVRNARNGNGADIGAFELVKRLRCAGKPVTVRATKRRTRGTGKRDVILGRKGPDVINGRGGNDVICGGGSADRLIGGPGSDLLLGQAGPDLLLGGGGQDVLKGGPGRDSEVQ